MAGQALNEDVHPICGECHCYVCLLQSLGAILAQSPPPHAFAGCRSGSLANTPVRWVPGKGI
jgi:hypothetical protein